MSRISGVLTTVVATTACGCVAAPQAAATDPVVSRGVTIPAFYTPPAPAARAVLDKQRIGTVKPTGPVRVVTGVQDDIVPHAQYRQLAVDWCEKGGDVTYKAVRLPNLGDKLLINHVAPFLTDQGDAVEWPADRLAGEPAGSNCRSIARRNPAQCSEPRPGLPGRGSWKSAGQALHLHLPAGSGASFLGPPTHGPAAGVPVALT